MTETDQDALSLARAQEAAERTDLEVALRELDGLEMDDAQRRAWQRTLHTIALHGQSDSPAEQLREASAWPRSCAPVAALLAAWVARFAAFRFDRELARACAAFFEQLNLPQTPTDLCLYEAQVWNAVWDNKVPQSLLQVATQDLEDETATHSTHHALAGLICWSHGERRRGLRHWRQASELARKSRSPHQQFLANIFLARARRRFGQPHLCRRILGSMLRSAETQDNWIPWLRWEQAMLGDAVVTHEQGPGPALRRSLEACDRGEEDRMRQELHHALADSAQWPLVREDIAAIAATFGVHDTALPQTGLLDWQTGKSDDLPGSVKGLVLALSEPKRANSKEVDLRSAHFVLVSETQPARRIHARAIALFPNIARLDANELRDAKTLTLIAELALLGGEGPLEAVFEAVYGFAYQSARHQAIIDTLVYRARKRLEGLATVERGEAALTLVPTRPFLVADPRNEAGLVDRVLSLIGSGTHTSATELALALGVSSRTIQRALKPLLEDGACVQRKEGKAIHYEVEDTTFHEPTKIIT